MSVWRSNTRSSTSVNWPCSHWPGFGVPASEIPSTGESGAALLYNDIAATGGLPTDEYRLEMLTYPSSGTFTLYERTDFSLVGAADGVYPATYEGFKNNVSYGEFTATFIIGNQTADVAYDIGEITYAASASNIAAGFGATIAYDVGAIDFSASASVTVPVFTSAVTYDIGEIAYAASASNIAAGVGATIAYDIGAIQYAVSASSAAPIPTDIDITISYDIGAITYNAVIINQGTASPYGVGYGITFTEPSRGIQF